MNEPAQQKQHTHQRNTESLKKAKALMAIDLTNYPGIPMDFPFAGTPYALSGSQPKLNVVKFEGRFYEPGTTPPELLQAYDSCEDMAQQMAPYCIKKLEQLGRSKGDTLVAVWRGILNKGWFNQPQSLWVIRRTAVILGWEIPKELVWPELWVTLGTAAAVQATGVSMTGKR
jgi:hypothetical protein